MDVHIIQQSPIRIAKVRHTGPYEQISSAFERLWEWVEAHQVPASRTIGLYFDNPDFVPTDELRSAACVEIPHSYDVMNRTGTPVEVGMISGGDYATTRYMGPYEAMEPVWSEFTQHVENNLKRALSDDPAMEVYVNDPSDTPADRLITDLYLPLAKR